MFKFLTYQVLDRLFKKICVCLGCIALGSLKKKLSFHQSGTVLYNKVAGQVTVRVRVNLCHSTMISHLCLPQTDNVARQAPLRLGTKLLIPVQLCLPEIDSVGRAGTITRNSLHVITEKRLIQILREIFDSLLMILSFCKLKKIYLYDIYEVYTDIQCSQKVHCRHPHVILIQ